LTTLQHMSRCSQDRLKNRKMKTMGGTHDVEYFLNERQDQSGSKRMLVTEYKE
jgi:hypothetical protein